MLALFAPFIAALLTPVLVKVCGKNVVWLLALVPAGLFGHYLAMLGEISSSETITGGVRWVPSLGVNFSWLIDGLSLTFALLITGIGFLIFVYTRAYLGDNKHLGRFTSFVFLFMGAMQGLVLSDSFLMLFVFWELTSITSFLLIGFDHKSEAARRAALQALLVTGLGGLLLLAGLIVIWNITGVRELSLLLATGETLRESPFYLLAFILVMCGAFTKSAQVPFHFWLPNAMEAPTPVSAYLHSATMVKAGVYLLMRLNPIMGDTVAWETVLPLFGTATLATGAILTVCQTDLKRMLAYSTVGSLGLLVLLVGIGGKTAIAAAALYLVAHSLFKAALFMVVGAIDHQTGTRDVTKVGGLRQAMPVTFAVGLMASLSMAGLFPFYGFIAKEETYYALVALWPVYGWVLVVTVLANSLMFAVACTIGLRPYFGSQSKVPQKVHDGSIDLLIAPMILAGVGMFAGLFWANTHFYFADPTAAAVLGQAVTIKTGIMPNLTPAFGLSITTIMLGLLACWKLDQIRETLIRVIGTNGWGPDRGFDWIVSGLISMSVRVTKAVQSGRLNVYVMTTFVLLGCALLVPIVFAGEMPSWPGLPTARFFDWAIVVIAAIGVLAVVFAKSRLTAIVSLGIQGFAVGVIFVLYGAPDLAFTQFMVETLSVVILALVMSKLRLSSEDHRTNGKKIIDFSISLAVAVGFVLLLFKVLEGTLDRVLPDYFEKYSYPLAHGRNIVNVILVDFRGVDTLGEIGVVLVAALAILALLGIRVNRSKAGISGAKGD